MDVIHFDRAAKLTSVSRYVSSTYICTYLHIYIYIYMYMYFRHVYIRLFIDVNACV